jgi:hypothetical protein
VGITDPFGVRLVAVGESVQKVQNVIWVYLFKLCFTEVLAETIDDRPI